MTFNTKVMGCWWQEDKGEWKVKLRETREGQEPREFEETCDLLLHATGVSYGKNLVRYMHLAKDG